MSDRPTAEFKILLKGLTDDELFARWSAEYDNKHTEFTALCIAEMNSRKLTEEAIAL